MLHRTLGLVIDTVYGTRCPACGRRRKAVGGLCETCAAALTPGRASRCPRCGVRLGPHVAVEKRCSHCRTWSFGFRSVCAVFSYGGTVRDQVHAVKFGHDHAAAERLTATFARAVSREDIPRNVGFVTAVPMFWWDRRVRGLNLAEELSAALARTHGLEHDGRLLRQVRSSPPQSTLTPADRFRNVAGLFTVRRGVRLDGRTVLLVDDVLTTGATASECSRVLRRAGAKRVHVTVLARTEPVPPS